MTIIGGFGVPTPTPPRKEIPVEHEWNWKHIAIAAIAVASILGLIAAISLFNTNPAATTTSSGWQPPPEPANPGGWIPPDEPNEPATTPTPAEIPSPDEIVPYETLIDISNLPKYIHSPGGVTNRIITDLEISNDKISGAFLNINPNPKATIGVAPIRIYFYDAQKNIIKREQWTCEHKYVKDGKRGSYTLTFANCQWPANYCNHTWTGYLQEQKKPIPQLKSMEKFYFSINCLVPNKARYIRIEDT